MDPDNIVGLKCAYGEHAFCDMVAGACACACHKPRVRTATLADPPPAACDERQADESMFRRADQRGPFRLPLA